MTQPDFRKGYLRIPLKVWANLFCRPVLTRRQFQLVAVVLRESWGWQDPGGQVHTWTKPLTTSHFAQATGLSTDHLRRDLCALTERGVLRENEQRYQLVADTRLWKTVTPPPRIERPLPPKIPILTAEVAPSTPELKKRKISIENGRSAPVQQLSPTVENWPSSFAAAPLVSPAGDRLADIVAAFVGSLDGTQADALRRWICEDGVAAVWSSLEPAFRETPESARQYFERTLAKRQVSSDRVPANSKEERA